nr:subtilisin-like protease SBT3.10 [Aegilops tauschii subsp. strangulata]
MEALFVLEQELVRDPHHGMLAAVLGSKQAAEDAILYSYMYGFSGFAAVLTNAQVAQLSDLRGVVRVVRNRVLDVHTTRSWDFMRVNPSPAGGSRILSGSRFGEESIIGVLDTGIWPESASIRDDGIGARFHGGGKGNASPEKGSILPTATDLLWSSKSRTSD